MSSSNVPRPADRRECRRRVRAKGLSGLKVVEADLQLDGNIDSIVIIHPTKYVEKQEARAARQLAKGPSHLAELLNKIPWQ